MVLPAEYSHNGSFQNEYHVQPDQFDNTIFPVRESNGYIKHDPIVIGKVDTKFAVAHDELLYVKTSVDVGK